MKIGVFHIFLQLSDDLHPATKQQLEEFLGDIAFITKELAEQGTRHVRDRRAVVNVGWGQLDRQQLAFVIDDQMQLEPVKPTHRVLTPLSLFPKQLVGVGPFGMADDNRRRVDKAYTADASLAGAKIAA